MNRQGVTPLKGSPRRGIDYITGYSSLLRLVYGPRPVKPRALCRAARDMTNFRRLESMFSRAV